MAAFPSIGRDRGTQGEPAGPGQGERAQAFVRRADPVVGVRGRGEPPFRKEPALPRVVRAIGHPEPPARPEEVPRHPRRLQPEHAVAMGDRLVQQRPSTW